MKDNNRYKESWKNFGSNVLNSVLVMLNILAIAFHQSSIAVFVILGKTSQNNESGDNNFYIVSYFYIKSQGKTSVQIH